MNWVGGVETPDAALALPKLSLSRGVAEEIQNAIAAGKEVTVHEKAINAYGFSGFGYKYFTIRDRVLFRVVIW